MGFQPRQGIPLFNSTYQNKHIQRQEMKFLFACTCNGYGIRVKLLIPPVRRGYQFIICLSIRGMHNGKVAFNSLPVLTGLCPTFPRPFLPMSLTAMAIQFLTYIHVDRSRSRTLLDSSGKMRQFILRQRVNGQANFRAKVTLIPRPILVWMD